MLDIGEVSRRSGFPASALRYYEEQGLISSIGRRGLKRIFGPEVLMRLSLIALGQAAGFSLGQIADMLGITGKPRIGHDILANKADELDRKIREMTALRDGLRHVMNCSASSHLECPRFQRIMRVVAVRQKTRRPRTGGKLSSLRDR